jgi:hypothetical protein
MIMAEVTGGADNQSQGFDEAGLLKGAETKIPPRSIQFAEIMQSSADRAAGQVVGDTYTPAGASEVLRQIADMRERGEYYVQKRGDLTVPQLTEAVNHTDAAIAAAREHIANLHQDIPAHHAQTGLG